MIRRAGEDDDGDRDCVLVVWGYSIRGKNRENMHGNQSGGKVSFTINAAVQVYKQTIQFVYLGGAVTADRDLSIEITQSLRGPGRASSGTRWKSMIARVCAYGWRCGCWRLMWSRHCWLHDVEPEEA